ncbi:cellulose synthase operon protein YhjQ/BcsQ [Pandoraea terrigena]|uniref:Cellulose synthase operon protein YhjQ n=1 Tax=Pandoraea terrigena TaxID=2508292 RepID=A0A5E4VKL4_9BURK|nr:cellulose synthase operon protein YhjQ/BcsQ [Pandoraea terrigena]VVE12721.1 cellulose synthase operon protein YhjQ [Pandoraea terrigena]
MLTLIAVVSSAGGAGRSTVTAHLAAQLAYASHPVVVLELDAQNSIGSVLGLREACGKGVLSPGVAPDCWHSVLCDTPAGVPLLPAGRTDPTTLAALVQWLQQDTGGLRRQLDALGLAPGTRVLIDTQRLPDMAAQAAVAAADLILGIVPVTTTGYVTQPDLMAACAGRVQMVPNLAAANSSFNNDLLHLMQARAGEAVVPLRIHRDEAISTMAANGKTLANAGFGSQAALDFARLAAWLMRATTPDEVLDRSGRGEK